MAGVWQPKNSLEDGYRHAIWLGNYEAISIASLVGELLESVIGYKFLGYLETHALIRFTVWIQKERDAACQTFIDVMTTFY